MRRLAILLLCLGCGSHPGSPGDPPPAVDTDPLRAARWVSSDDYRITINQIDEPKAFLTLGFVDFRPSWSVTGRTITFLRLIDYDPDNITDFTAWKTILCVINTNSTGLRALSNGLFADFDQTWTRDGTGQVIFNRFGPRGARSNDIYLIHARGTIGDEVLVSDPAQGFEWAFSGLRDGRILMERTRWPPAARPVTQTFLLAPNPGGVGTYEELSRPSTDLWHELSLSPSETRVAYMLDTNDDTDSYEDSVLYYADFDLAGLTISNPVAITTLNMDQIDENPRWNGEETHVIYDSNQSGDYEVYAYRLSDGVTMKISEDSTTDEQFGAFEGVPK